MKASEILQRRHEENQRSTRYYVEVDVERVAPADLFRQEFWVNQINLKKGDILRCVASDGSYDFEMRVNSAAVKDNKNNVTVGLYPIIPDYIVEAANSGAAAVQMASHVNGKPVPRVENAGADGWRVIGFSGEIASRNHVSQAAATLAMVEYVNAANIESIAEVAALSASVGIDEPVPADVPPTRLTPETARPGQFSHAKRKEIVKREEKLAKRREADERNKARNAERQAAEAAAAGN